MNDQLSLLYDREADVLYVAKGHPKFTDYVELNNNIILRLDPTTKDIVGFTIVDFAGRFASKILPLNIPLDATFELVGKRRKYKVAMEAKTTYRVKSKKGVTPKVHA